MRPLPGAKQMLANAPASSPAPTASEIKNTGPSQWKMRLQSQQGIFAVASSADGRRLVAVEPGIVHTSPDSGITWKSVPLAGQWRTVTSSADGTRLAMAGKDCAIHTSSDSGATWTECPSGAHNWSGIASSADGTRLVAVRLESESGGIPIHISGDGGATWVEKDAGGDWWSGVASSADGTRLVVVGNGWALGSHIVVSHDSGETWSKRMTDRQRRWNSVASSADGTRLVAVDEGFDAAGGQIFISADSGETWKARGVSQTWGAVSSSSTGHRLLAVAGGRGNPSGAEGQAGNIHVSTDFGENWEVQETPRIWTSAASSEDGTHLLAVALSGGGSQVYTLDIRSFEARFGGDQRLLQLNTGFTSRYESDAQKPYLAAVAALNQSYIANGIAKARAAAQGRGSLKEVVAFDEVKARIERGEGVPEVDEPGTPESLKTLRSIYRDALAKIAAERDAKAAPLYDIYLKTLDGYATELTRAGNLDKARIVQTLRGDIAAQAPQIAAVPAKPTPRPSPPAPPTATTTNPNAVAVSSGSSWRTAALYLVNNGGSCVVEKSGARISVPTENEIPSGKFDVVELNLDRYNSLFPPLKDADLQPLAGLRDLRSVWIRPMHPGLTEAGLAFLAANSDLTSLNLEGAPDIGDGLLEHLSGAKKLQFFRLTGATKFTGKGLGRMPFLNSLREFVCEGSTLGDEVLAALGQCRNLDVLRISDGTFTDEGFKALGALKSLRILNAYRTTFGDEAASSISGLANLTELNLGDTKITDLGLAKLRSLKKLNSLNLTGSQVTVESAEAFQKLMPQCRVSR